MKLHCLSLISLVLLVFTLVGCNADGPAGDPNQMAAARDAQGKAESAQRNGMAASRGAGSADAAAKAGKQ
jgi:hypothetical protein